MAFPSSSIWIVYDLLLYSIDFFNDNGFLDKFTLTNLDLKYFLRWVFKVNCEAAGMLLQIGREKARRENTLATFMP